MAKKPQIEKSRKAARELECDESEDKLNAALKTIGKGKLKRPDPDPPPLDDPGAMVEWAKRNLGQDENETD